MSAKSKMTMLLELSDKMFNNKLAKMQSNWSKGVDKMKMKYQELIDQVPMLGRAMELIKNPWVGLMAGGIAFLAFTGKAVAATERFDSAFLPIKQLNLDKSAGEMDRYRSKIRDAAFEVGLNLEASTNAMYDLQSATGLFGNDAIAVFTKVGRYSKATGANINDAMNSTTKAMKAFGLGVNDIDKLLESNAKTVQVGITTFDELARVQTEYAGATSAAGQSVDVGNKVFAMFTSIAKSSDIAANMTKTFFQGLGQQAENVKKYLNVDVFDVNGNMRDADKLLMDINDKFKTMSDEQITKAINQIGGPEGLRAAFAKVKTGAEDMIDTFAAFDSSAFSLEEAVKNAEGDFTKMKQIFFDRIEILMTKWGEKIIPMLAGIFDTMTPVLEWLYKNIDWLLPVFGTFIGLLIAVKIAMWAFNAAVMANPIGLIIAAVGALIALVVVAIKNFDTWGSVILMMMGPLGFLISIIKNIADHWDSIVEAFKSDGIIGGLKRIHQVILDTLLKPVSWLLGKVAELTGWEWAKNAEDGIMQMREKMNTVTDKERKARSGESDEDERSSNPLPYDKANPLLDDKGNPLLEGNKTPNGDLLAAQVGNVTGDAKQTRNVTVNIEALAKDSFIMRKDATEGMTLQDVEDWFNESMMRVVRSIETS